MRGNQGARWITWFGMWRVPDGSASRQLLIGLQTTAGRLVGGWKPGCAASSILEDEYYMDATRTRYGLSRSNAIVAWRFRRPWLIALEGV